MYYYSPIAFATALRSVDENSATSKMPKRSSASDAESNVLSTSDLIRFILSVCLCMLSASLSRSVIISDTRFWVDLRSFDDANSSFDVSDIAVVSTTDPNPRLLNPLFIALNPAEISFKLSARPDSADAVCFVILDDAFNESLVDMTVE